MPIRDAAQCSATTKVSGERCRQPAVKGFAVCRLHGAGNVKQGRPGGRPIVHGRYSKRLPERLAGRYAEALSDSKLLELRDEIALAEARMGELLQRLSGTESGENWRRVQEATVALDVAIRGKDVERMEAALAKLRQATRQGQSDRHQWQEILEVLDLRRRLTESERKRHVEMQSMITSERAMILLAAVVSIIKEHVHEPTTLASISTSIRGLISDTSGAESES